MPGKRPQLVVLDPEIARHLADHAAEHRWLVRHAKSLAAVRELARERRPTVAFLTFIPADPAAVALVAELHRAAPDAAVVAVSDEKLSEPDRVAWTAVLMDLGARYVLFPPLTKAVLEDLAGGLMPGGTPGPAAPGDEVIDLADEDDE
jgi:DNA-binding response OmpR family regulator